MMLVGGVVSGLRRPRHRLSDAAAARHVLFHRHAGDGGGGADADHQLGLRRRIRAAPTSSAREQCLVCGCDYIQYLFLMMLGLSVLAVAVARAIERSRLGVRLRHDPRRRTGGRGFRRADAAVEADRRPCCRAALMGMAGAPLPYLRDLSRSASAFSLTYAVNTIAMPLIGGTSSWPGPMIGAVLLGTLQQVATVTISSPLILLIVGVMLVGFVVAAPNGIIGGSDLGTGMCHRFVRQWQSHDRATSGGTGLGKRFGGFVALDEIDLAVAPASASA